MAPLDLAHTPALLQLAQAAANEVDTNNFEPISATGPKESASPVVVDVIAESTQQVVNQLSEVVANAKQNDIQGSDSSNSSPVERGASTTAKPEEDLLDIVESFIADATEDDDEESTDEQKQKPEAETTPSQTAAAEVALPQNDKDELNDVVEEEEDEDDLSRK